MINKIIEFIIYRLFHLDLSETTLLRLEQFVKFCLVGVINNLVYYIGYLLLIKIGIHYTAANFLGFTISVLNAYFWNNRYVFKTDGILVWWKTLIKTYLSYAGTGIVLSSCLLVFFVEICGISKTIAPLIDVFITMPINYLVNKFWVYRSRFIRK